MKSVGKRFYLEKFKVITKHKQNYILLSSFVVISSPRVLLYFLVGFRGFYSIPTIEQFLEVFGWLNILEGSQ